MRDVASYAKADIRVSATRVPGAARSTKVLRRRPGTPIAIDRNRGPGSAVHGSLCSRCTASGTRKRRVRVSFTDSLFKRPGGQASALREVARLPAAVRPVRLEKLEEGEAPQSAGAERRTRGPPSGGPVPSSEGTPAHDAGRRALRRFTVEIFAGPGPPRLGPRLRAGENCPPVVQLAPSFRVVVPERRGPRRPESPVDETERPPARSRASSTRYGFHSPLQQTASPVDALERAGMRA